MKNGIRRTKAMNALSSPKLTVLPLRHPGRRRSIIAVAVIIFGAALAFAFLVAEKGNTFLAYWLLLLFAPILLLTWLASWREAASNGVVPSDQTIKVMLVDDSPFLLTVLTRILAEETKISLMGPFSAAWPALRAALKSRPDLVLLELDLPHLNGPEVTRYLKLLPDPPVVFMVATGGSPNTESISRAASVDACVVKGADLEAQMRSWLQEWFGKHTGA
jgi:CheY-like chemotaxis protein